MIGSKIYRKFFFLTSAIFITATVVAVATSMILNEVNRVRDQERFEQRAPTFALAFARMIDSLDENKLTVVRKFNEAANGHSPFIFDLLDADGKSLLSAEQILAKAKLPKAVYESAVEPTPWRPGPPNSTIRLKSEVPQYLRLSHRGFGPDQGSEKSDEKSAATSEGRGRPSGPPGMHGPGGPPGPPRSAIIITIASLLAAIFIASGVSIFFIFSTFRDKAKMAEDIIEDLKNGNLKSRFPITKVDEVGQLMVSFNHMADEIERVVLNLRQSEKDRMELIGHLTHDLRTPIASLKNLLENLLLAGERIQPQVRTELGQLSLKEIDYLGRLVEDLLFLARVIEPKYNQRHQRISVSEFLNSEIQSLKTQNPQLKFTVSEDGESADLSVVEGDEHLLQRLWRNAFENAIRFAKASIHVELKTTETHLNITIEDDGPGLDDSQLRQFGVRRSSRQMSQQNGIDRVSYGFGSIIMVAIAKLHEGDVKIENIFDAQGHRIGARLIVRFRRSRAGSAGSSQRV